MFMRSTPHSVEMQTDRIRRFAFHVFLLPFVAESMDVLADEEVRAAFFVPLRQTAPDGFGHKARTSYIMQTSASIQRTAQLRPLGISIADIKAWLNAKSELFTYISGFRVTRREVLRVHLAFVAMVLGTAAATHSLLAAAICVALAGYNVYRLNVEDEDNWLKSEERIEMKEGGKR